MDIGNWLFELKRKLANQILGFSLEIWGKVGTETVQSGDSNHCMVMIMIHVRPFCLLPKVKVDD